MRIAVIGSGISGNVAAYHLSQQHEVDVFEASDRIGGHTHTHDVIWEKKHYAIDTGFIVFNERTYPNFIALLDQLNVSFKTTEMSFSVKKEADGLEYNGHSIDTLFAQRRNLFKPSFHRMVRDILRFNQEAIKALKQGKADISFGVFLESQRYSLEFINHYILPMGAAIWSSTPRQILSFPAAFFIRFFDHHGLLQVNNRPRWFVVSGGSREYLHPLIRSFKDRVHVNSPIETIKRFPTHVEIGIKGKEAQVYDAVFIATHSDQALRILQNATQVEVEVLSSIKYQKNEAVLHTDYSVLPMRQKAWAAWNYQIPNNEQSQVAVTYNMNILQGINAPVQFCVTLNNEAFIDKRKIIKRIEYEHPVFTPDSIHAQARHQEVNGVKRTWFCGAYWGNGFHEDGVVSALNAVDHFNEYCHEELYLRRAS